MDRISPGRGRGQQLQVDDGPHLRRHQRPHGVDECLGHGFDGLGLTGRAPALGQPPHREQGLMNGRRNQFLRHCPPEHGPHPVHTGVDVFPTPVELDHFVADGFQLPGAEVTGQVSPYSRTSGRTVWRKVACSEVGRPFLTYHVVTCSLRYRLTNMVMVSGSGPPPVPGRCRPFTSHSATSRS